MKNPKLLLIIPLLFASILPVLPSALPLAHAATGEICITDTSTVGCPASPQTLFASNGSTLTIQVQIQGSDDLNGFNIQINTDPTVLQAAGASVSGSILGSSATVVLECLDGTLVAGTACDATDVPGVLHFAATRLGSNVPGNGLLFTATYNVVALTPGISLDIMSQSISNGTTTPNSETTLGALFSNLTDFAVSSSPTSIETAPSVSAMSTITFTSFGGFTDFLTITVAPSAGLSASTADSGLFLPPDVFVTTVLTVSAAVSGSYSVDVCGVGSSITHCVTVPVVVAAPTFTLSASPSSLSLAPGDTGTSMITVGSVSGFSGTVALSSAVSPASGLTCSVAPASVAAPGTSTLTCVAGSAGSYMVTVTGVSGVTKTTTVSVAVGTPDFSIDSVPDTLSVLRNSPSITAASTLNFASINNYASDITLTFVVTHPFADTPGSSTIPVALPAMVTLTSGGTASAGLFATIAKATAGTGLYVVTVTASGSGGKTHSVDVNIWVIDFALAPQDTTVTLINTPGTVAADFVAVSPIGAPLNADGFAINPGLTEGNVVYPTEYYPGSATGRNFEASTGLDISATRNRCFLATFDSSNAEIFPHFDTAGRIDSFAGPVVHVSGDQFGFGFNFNGCRLDAFWYVDPLNGNAIDNSFDSTWVVIELLTTTPNGTYHVPVCYIAGGDANCFSLTIILVAPPAAPALSQNTGRTATVSLAAGGQLTLKLGVQSSASVTEWVQGFVTATSSDGSITITGTTGVFALPAGGKSLNMPVTLDFSGAPAGTTFNLSIVILYGVAPHYLTQTSTATVGSPDKTTGSVVVTP